MKNNTPTFWQKFMAGLAGGSILSFIILTVASLIAPTQLYKILTSEFEVAPGIMGTKVQSVEGIILVFIICLLGSLLGFFIAVNQNKNTKIITISWLSLLIIPILFIFEQQILYFFCNNQLWCGNMSDTGIITVLLYTITTIPLSIISSMIVTLMKKLI